MKIMSTTIKGKVFVLDDNIDTDQIIPAEYLTLVPSKPDEYEKLGSYAMIGLPDRYDRFIPEGESKTIYSIIIAGENFGCGSSREHAPIALGAAGLEAVVARPMPEFSSVTVQQQVSSILGNRLIVWLRASKLVKKQPLILIIISSLMKPLAKLLP